MKLEYEHQDIRYKIVDVSAGDDKAVLVDAFEDFDVADQAWQRLWEDNLPALTSGKMRLRLLEEQVFFSRKVV